MQTLQQIFTQALSENQLNFAASDKQKFIDYLELIQSWNRVFNLTTITSPREMIYLHLVDSLVVEPYLTGTHCLDVGSGAGFPGIPLAIINPNRQFVLLDKSSKKTHFLTQAVAELGLNNVQVVKERVLDFHPSQCFDSILSRAFGTLHMFVETSEHLLCPNGTLIAMKGKYPQDELHEIPSRYQAKTIRLDIKGIDIERHVVCIQRKTTGD